MKYLILITVALLGVSGIFAQTKISDKQEVYGTWSKSKSPYIVEGEAIVPSSQTLIIEPGVVVQFKTGEDRDYAVDGVKSSTFNVGFLRVFGTIKAEGTAKKLIKFTRNGKDGFWGNIAIDSRSKNNSFKYCWIEAAFYIRYVVLSSNDNATGAISFFNSEGTVQNCFFINNGWTALNCKEGSNPDLKNNTIYGNKYGIECNTGSFPIITSTIVWNNETAFYVNGGASPKISYSLIQDSEFIEGIVDKGNNIFAVDPQFAKPAKNKFKLKSSSPAFKKGQGGVNMGAL